jgi:Winged helix DNA-binding domain
MHLLATRLRQQKLDRTDLRSPEAVVAWLGAVQAQEYGPARWALGLRCKSTTDAAVVRACDEGRILRLHILRPTWHFVAPADIRWMLAVSGPRVNAISAAYYRKMELDDRTFARSRRAIERALARGEHLSRLKLAGVLRTAGIEASGQRLACVVMKAELDGVICSGAYRGKLPTYALLDDRARATPAIETDEALARLAARYFTSHGPATLRDYVWWSGLRVGEATRGIEAAGKTLRRLVLEERTYWLSSGSTLRSSMKPSVLLLPVYDEYLIAYKDRQAILDGTPPANPAMLLESPHFFMIDGKLRGTWRRAVFDDRVVITVRPQRRLTLLERDAVETELARHSRFMERPVSLELPSRSKQS